MDIRNVIRERIGKLEVSAKEINDVAITIDDEIKFLIRLLGEQGEFQLSFSDPEYKNVFQVMTTDAIQPGGLKPISYKNEAELLLDKTMRGE